MKRILVFSWFYPPVNSSEGLVTFKLLNNSRFEYDVFTQNGETPFSYGNNAALENGENVRSVFANSDSIEKWKEEAIRYFREHRGEYDCIMTRSMPQESHEIGLAIKKEFSDVFWIASFGDPIKNNLYQHLDLTLHSFNETGNLINRNKGLRFRLSPKRILKVVYWRIVHRAAVRQRRRFAKLEDDTLRLCDRVIFNNDSQKKFMAQSEKVLNKSVILHHSYDKSLYPDAAPKEDGKVKFLFVGHLDDIRTPRPLFEAIRELRESCPDLPERAQFDFYGDMSEKDLAYLAKNTLWDVVNIRKNVPYIESLGLMREADWNVHIDGNISAAWDENVFFAAKIADYFGSGSSILAVTMNSGSAHDSLKAAGELVLSYSVEELKQYLYLIVYKRFTVDINERYVEENFSAEMVAKKFDDEVIAPLLDVKR